MATHAQVLGRKHCRSAEVNGYRLLSQNPFSIFTVAVTEAKEYEAELVPTVRPKTPAAPIAAPGDAKSLVFGESLR